MNAIIEFLRRLLGIGSTTAPPDTSDPCNAHACVDAKARLNDARKSFNSICTGLKAVRAILVAAQQVVSIKIDIWAMIRGLFLSGFVGIFGGVLLLLIGPVLILISIVIYFISWAVLISFPGVALNLVAALAEERKKFSDALKDVVSQCPEHCRGDVSVPECPLD